MLKGILEGIKGILEEGLKTEEVLVLKAHITSAKSMLEGVIKGLEKSNLGVLGNIIESPIDLEARQAKLELGG